MSAESRIFDLVERGLFKDSALAIDSDAELSKTLRVLRNKLESHVGSPAVSRNRAEALMRTKLTPLEKAMCLETIGRASLGSGDNQQGVHALRQA